MNEINGKPITTLSYWPNKEFEVVGIIDIRSYDHRQTTISMNKTLEPHWEKGEYMYRGDVFDFTKNQILEQDWDLFDAIVDVKFYSDLHGEEHWIGTAIKFKK